MNTPTQARRTGRIAVIGAGIGGLVAAIDLARVGFHVDVFERAAQVGGKMREMVVGEHRLDGGPTVLTMRWVFDELFHESGQELDSWVRLLPMHVLARHAWGKNARLDLHADKARSAEAIGRFAGADEARRYLAFCDHARRIYEIVKRPFLQSQRPTVMSIAREVPQLGVRALLQIDAYRTMWKSLGTWFHDRRLRQLFARYATYCGSSPFEAAATLNLIAHVEQEGVFRVEGGMYQLARALERLARSFGVSFHFHAHVDEIIVERGRARGVRLARGDDQPADAVVLNADIAALAWGHFGHAAAFGANKLREKDRSLSALTWAIVGQAEGFPLGHHNVFFSDDYQEEFRQLFDQHIGPRTPTVYVCAQDRADEEHVATPPENERFLIVVNAPALGDRKPLAAGAEMDSCEANMLTQLRRCGLEIQARASVRTTPASFEQLFPATGGALYGRVSHGPMSPLQRDPSRLRTSRLYAAGGSVHPGAGVPMAALSGRLAAAALMQDLVLTGP